MNEMRRRFVRDGLLADGGEAAMAFDTGVGALLGWIKFVGCLSLATVTLGVTPTAWAQGWSGSVSNNVDPVLATFRHSFSVRDTSGLTTPRTTSRFRGRCT